MHFALRIPFLLEGGRRCPQEPGRKGGTPASLGTVCHRPTYTKCPCVRSLVQASFTSCYDMRVRRSLLFTEVLGCLQLILIYPCIYRMINSRVEYRTKCTIFIPCVYILLVYNKGFCIVVS